MGRGCGSYTCVFKHWMWRIRVRGLDTWKHVFFGVPTKIWPSLFGLRSGHAAWVYMSNTRAYIFFATWYVERFCVFPLGGKAPGEVQSLHMQWWWVIAQGKEVVLQEQGETRVLGYMLQFDGNHHKELNLGGAGIGLFQILRGSIQYLRGFGIAHHECRQDNVEAEAQAVAEWLEALVLQLATLHTMVQLWTMPIFVQGDILPIARYFASHGRIRRLDIVNI